MLEVFRELVEFSPDAQLVVNSQGVIVYANPGACRLFGYKPSALSGTPLELLVPLEVRESHAKHRHAYGLEPKVREMGSRGVRLLGVRLDGSRFPAEIRLGPIQAGDGVLIAAVIRDATDSEQLNRALADAKRAAEAANAAKSHFLASASHDLRQPLQSLRLLNSVLQRQELTDNIRQIVQDEAQMLEAMGQLVHALLNVVRLEAGTWKPEVANVGAAILFDDLKRQFESLAVMKGLELRVQRPEPDVMLRTDSTLLREVLQNLLANAVRYTDHGYVSLSLVRIAPGAARIAVQDSGMGIAREVQDRIFEDFFQDSTAKNRGGTGLGLGIVRRISKLLNISISLCSTAGVGTTFNVELATCDDSVTVPVAEANVAGSQAMAPSRCRLVIVEDSPSVRAAVKLYLQIEGYQVHAVGSLQELAAWLEHATDAPDVLVTDFQLGPTERGSDAIWRVQSKFSRTIPTIVLTGDTSAVPEHALAGCEVRLLNKPVDGEQLLAAIHSLMHAVTGRSASS